MPSSETQATQTVNEPGAHASSSRWARLKTPRPAALAPAATAAGYVFSIALATAACSAGANGADQGLLPIPMAVPASTDSESNDVPPGAATTSANAHSGALTSSASTFPPFVVDEDQPLLVPSPEVNQAGAASFCEPEPFPKNYTCEGPEGPWAEALQKTLWFFNVNKSGPGVYCTDVQWRGDAHVDDAHIALDPAAPNGVNLPRSFIDANRAVLDPDGNGEVDLAGGYHDAGDYIKFTMTTAYAASMIAWSVYEYPESFEATSLLDEALGQIRWATDYFLKSTFLDADGALLAFAHQVSDASDHSCFWMPPEVRRSALCPRRGYFVWEEHPAADLTAAAAATLALAGNVVRAHARTSSDVDYANRCITVAKALYSFASRFPEARVSDDGGLYTSNSSTDDLAWAAIWLYLADPKANEDYLAQTTSGPKPWLSFGAQSNLMRPGTSSNEWIPAWAESSPHSWDAVRAGVVVKLAQLTALRGDPMASEWRAIARETAMGFAKGPATPDGFYVYMGWGSARYNAAAQFTTLLFAKFFPDDAANSELLTWADRQIDYVLGDNDLQKSFVMGFGETYALQPHHAAGHASIYGLPSTPAENRHIIWGALVNGPQGDGSHVDDRDDFGSNEVTIDYNGALVAALAAHYERRGVGQCPLLYFPPLEEPIQEFYAMGNLNTELGSCRTQVNVRTMNESIHPPRYDNKLTARFWLDASEVVQAGKDPSSAISATLMRDTGMNDSPSNPTEVRGPIVCDPETNVYFLEFDYSGALFWGQIPAIGSPRDLLLDYGVEYNDDCPWDAANDWSIQGLSLGETEAVTKTPFITVYSDGELIWGQEPPCMGEQKKVDPPRKPAYAR